MFRELSTPFSLSKSLQISNRVDFPQRRTPDTTFMVCFSFQPSANQGIPGNLCVFQYYLHSFFNIFILYSNFSENQAFLDFNPFLLIYADFSDLLHSCKEDHSLPIPCLSLPPSCSTILRRNIIGKFDYVSIVTLYPAFIIDFPK